MDLLLAPVTVELWWYLVLVVYMLVDLCVLAYRFLIREEDQPR
jgi:hypothetical protein